MVLSDPESWSGEWVESFWSPLTRAKDRGLDGLVTLFTQYEEKLKNPTTEEDVPVTANSTVNVGGVVSAGSAGVGVPSQGLAGSGPLMTTGGDGNFPSGSPPRVGGLMGGPVDILPYQQGPQSAIPVKSQPLNNYNGINPLNAIRSNPNNFNNNSNFNFNNNGSTNNMFDVQGLTNVNNMSLNNVFGSPPQTAPEVNSPPNTRGDYEEAININNR